jgi:hypothetical protein
MFGIRPVFFEFLSSKCSVSIQSMLNADSDSVAAFMDDRLKNILDTLPTKSPRSRMEPYREFIQELGRQGSHVPSIARILSEKCQVHIDGGTHPSTH